jgi:4-amino-4-deoxy-L-arabinose transferase-like glycosyltransferase
VFLLIVSCFSCLSWSLFFHRLTERDLWSSHEGRAAQDAQSVLDPGQWGLPRLFDHHVELQKPPLYYWFVAMLARLRGGSVDAFAVRLPAALGGGDAGHGGALYLARAHGPHRHALDARRQPGAGRVLPGPARE